MELSRVVALPELTGPGVYTSVLRRVPDITMTTNIFWALTVRILTPSSTSIIALRTSQKISMNGSVRFGRQAINFALFNLTSTTVLPFVPSHRIVTSRGRRC